MKKNFKNKTQKREGQVMLLTVLVLSAVFLSATIIAGLLMVYQLSQVTQVVDSAQAIYAADAAIERALFQIFRCNSDFGSGAVCLIPGDPSTCGPFPPLNNSSNPANIFTANAYVPFCTVVSNTIPSLPTFSNGATYQLGILNQSGDDNLSFMSDEVRTIRTTGRAGKSTRSFEVNVQ